MGMSRLLDSRVYYSFAGSILATNLFNTMFLKRDTSSQ